MGNAFDHLGLEPVEATRNVELMMNHNDGRFCFL